MDIMQSSVKTIAGRIALILAIPLMFGADESPPLNLGPTLGPLAQKYHLPGVVGAILRGDRIVALGSTGVRKLGSPEPLPPSVLVPLASDTKAMTAILI